MNEYTCGSESKVLELNKIRINLIEKSPTKTDILKWMGKGTRGLWTQTGGTLEHVVLWWCNTPLACQPVAAARHLRDWLISFQFDGMYSYYKTNRYRCCDQMNIFRIRCSRNGSIDFTLFG